MDNFVYHTPTKYVFGKDVESSVGKEAACYGKKVLLHYGSGSIKKSGLYDKIIQSLTEAELQVFELGGVQSNPKLSLVRKGIEICKKEDIDLILAVGGGSVIDSSKAIAVGHRYEGDVWDFFTGKAQPEIATPVGTVLTIAAAGSEGSTGCVVTNEDGDYKLAFNHAVVIPKFSFLNPKTTFTVPAYHTFAGVADILAHLMERYFTNTKHVEFTDRLIESTMKTVINNAKVILKNPQDYEARAEIMWAGTIAHNNLLNTGRVGDWASHNIEHELSGIYDISHGAGLAVVFPAWMKYVYKHDMDRFAQFAVRVLNVEMDYFDREKTVLNGIQALENFFKSLDMPIRLKDLDIDDSRIVEMAKKSVENGFQGNFLKLDEQDILNIYKLAL